MNSLIRNLSIGSSVMALCAGANAAYAQQVVPTDDIETVNSSAGRLDLQGFTQPTPVTVIGIDTLNRDAKVDLGDEIRELPQIRGGTSITTGSNSGCIVQVDAGVDTVALRNLGAQRNLVLFDHQRVGPSAIQEGFVDLSLIPSGLVQRVDVVTGGASAAWGSDAVTGVINIVINKTYEGFKGSVTYSNSTEVSNPVYKASFAWGTSFLGGKGHIVAAADLTVADSAVFAGDVWAKHPPVGKAFVYNSAYCAGTIVYAAGATTGGTCSSVAAGVPALTYGYFDLGNTQTVEGGLVASNTNGVAGSPIAVAGNLSGYGGAGAAGAGNYLKGVFFTGENAAPNQFNYGTLYGTTTCYNGCTNGVEGTGGWGNNDNPYHTGNYFTYASYQVLPDVKASVQLNYSRNTTALAGNNIMGTNRVIYADNPYLPDSVAQDFVCNTGGASAAGLPGTAACSTVLSNGYDPYTHSNMATGPTGTALTLSQIQAHPAQTLTANFEFSGNRPNPSPSATAGTGGFNSATDFTWAGKCAALYQNCGWANKVVMRGVFTLDGSIGDDWTWSGYIQDTNVRIKEDMEQDENARANNALDAVRVTSGNVGTSGLPVGSIQCRALLNPGQSTLSTAPSANTGVTGIAAQIATNSLGISTAGELAGCVPFDPFGNGDASAGTLAYISPAKYDSAVYPLSESLTHMEQTAAEYTLQGVLPWKLPAGDVGVAMGVGWRLEAQGQTSDARQQLNLFPSGNFGANWKGHLHEEEGFLEVDAPILKNDIVQALDVTMAGRMTDYSFSGLVETWKLGLTSQINDDIKTRVTWSYDIRQPDIWDLYAPGANVGSTCPSFIPGAALPNACFAVNSGNANLSPEKSQTIAAGFVFTPSFLDGVTASIDWYQIHIHGALVASGSAETLCQQGQLNYCSLLVFANQGSFLGAQGCGIVNGADNPNRFGCAGADTTSQIIYTHTAPLNAALLTTAGFDFAMAYGFDLFTGSADVGFNGNYMYDYSRTLAAEVTPPGGAATTVNVTYQGAGATGGFYSGGNRFRGTITFNYREGAWSFGTNIRINGDSVMNRGAEGYASYIIPLQTISFNKVNGQDVAIPSSGQSYPGWTSTNYTPYAFDLDLRASYKWSNNITLFSAIDNVNDTPMGAFSNNGQRRTYRLGVRFNY